MAKQMKLYHFTVESGNEISRRVDNFVIYAVSVDDVRESLRVANLSALNDKITEITDGSFDGWKETIEIESNPHNLMRRFADIHIGVARNLYHTSGYSLTTSIEKDK